MYILIRAEWMVCRWNIPRVILWVTTTYISTSSCAVGQEPSTDILLASISIYVRPNPRQRLFSLGEQGPPREDYTAHGT